MSKRLNKIASITFLDKWKYWKAYLEKYNKKSNMLQYSIKDIAAWLEDCEELLNITENDLFNNDIFSDDSVEPAFTIPNDIMDLKLDELKHLINTLTMYIHELHELIHSNDLLDNEYFVKDDEMKDILQNATITRF